MKKSSFKIDNVLVNKYLSSLKNHGDIFLSGGFLRDTLLNKQPKDIDFVFIGDKSDIINKLPQIKFTKNGFDNDILFLVDSKTKVDFKIFPKGTSLEDICYTKDYTTNFLFYQNNTLFNPYNSYEDTLNLELRDCFLDENRFNKNPVNVGRALKFLSTHNYKFEKNTLDLFLNNFEIIKKTPPSKLQELGNEVLFGEFLFSNTIPFLHENNILNFPSINEIISFSSSDHSFIDQKNSFIYFSWLLNFITFDELNSLFSLFKVPNQSLVKGLSFFKTIQDFKDEKVFNLTPITCNLLLFYFKNFEKDDTYKNILIKKIKNEI